MSEHGLHDAPHFATPPAGRWQRMFDAAEALARQHTPATIVQAERFDADLLRHCMATTQPVVFHTLPAEWACANHEANAMERTCATFPCSSLASHRLSFQSFLSQLRQGSHKGTGGLPASEQIVHWAGLPRQSGPLEWGPPHLFGGIRGAVTPLHRDAGDGLNVHIMGRKQWTLLSPVHACALLHPSSRDAATGFQESDISLERFESLHALSNTANPQLRQVVSAGQAIFVPSGWFHEVRLLDVAVSLAAPLFPKG